MARISQERGLAALTDPAYLHNRARLYALGTCDLVQKEKVNIAAMVPTMPQRREPYFRTKPPGTKGNFET
ncbi:MAG: hypothetical protein HY787_15870 [Deltaproteobacteria bacterium]|nr:hypothetical protein [Deltaproteobacteria bacterium]